MGNSKLEKSLCQWETPKTKNYAESTKLVILFAEIWRTIFWFFFQTIFWNFFPKSFSNFFFKTFSKLFKKNPKTFSQKLFSELFSKASGRYFSGKVVLVFPRKCLCQKFWKSFVYKLEKSLCTSWKKVLKKFWKSFWKFLESFRKKFLKSFQKVLEHIFGKKVLEKVWIKTENFGICWNVLKSWDMLQSSLNNNSGSLTCPISAAFTIFRSELTQNNSQWSYQNMWLVHIFLRWNENRGWYRYLIFRANLYCVLLDSV